MFEEEQEEHDVLDCLIEVHELKENAKVRSDETLIKTICDFSSRIDLDAETEKAIDTFFKEGYLNGRQRQKIENCYVLMNNTLCWVEPKNGDGDAGVYHAIFVRK